MPIYDFVCDKAPECPTRLEDHYLTFAEHALVQSKEETMHCPTCDGPMHQVFSGSMNFILKGDGWPGKDIEKENQKLIERNTRLAQKPKEYREMAKWICEKSGKGIKKARGGPDV